MHEGKDGNVPEKKNIETRIEDVVTKRRPSLEFLASRDLCAQAGKSGNRSWRGQKTGGIETKENLLKNLETRRAQRCGKRDGGGEYSLIAVSEREEWDRRLRAKRRREENTAVLTKSSDGRRGNSRNKEVLQRN